MCSLACLKFGRETNPSTFRLLEEAFPVDEPGHERQRPSNASEPTHGYESLLATYTDPAYGSIELCALPKTFAKQDFTSEGNGETCEELLRRPQFKEHNQHELPPTFVASIGKIWADVLLLKHYDGNLFNLTATRTYSKNDTFVEISDKGLAKFGDGGVGFTGYWGGVVDKAAHIDMDKYGARDGSEVFFTKT